MSTRDISSGVKRMKTKPSRNAQVVAPPGAEPQPKRRQLVVGAGVAAGAALATAAALRPHGAAPDPAAKAGSDPAQGEGYRLTDHVLRYYETTRT
jgi:hypothetical protein